MPLPALGCAVSSSGLVTTCNTKGLELIAQKTTKQQTGSSGHYSWRSAALANSSRPVAILISLARNTLTNLPILHVELDTSWLTPTSEEKLCVLQVRELV